MQITRTKGLLYIFLFSSIIYFISLYIEIRFLFTDSFYSQAYGGTNGDIQDLLLKVHTTNWLNFVIAPFYVFLLALAFAFGLYFFLTIANHKAKIIDCLFVGSVGQLVFAINYLIVVILKLCGVFEFNIDTANDVFYSQSIASIIEAPKWSLFACERVSVIEIIYVLITSFVINRVFSISFFKSMGIVLLMELFVVLLVSTIQICHYLVLL